MSTLDELEALLAKATPGEWSYSGPHEEQGEWWIASPSERKDIPWSREDAALIAASRNHLGELLRIARAVASRAMGLTDGLGRHCPMCGGWADYEHPDVPGYSDEALAEYERPKNEREAACIAAIVHDHDCVYVAARELAGGAP